MNYKEISDKWKVFLAENAFKEDIVIKPEKKKKKKKKEIIVSEEEVNEWEEFQQDESVINEPSGAEGYDDKSLDEMSSVSGGAVEGAAGGSFISMEDFKDRWRA